MRITFHNDPKSRYDTGSLNYTGRNWHEVGKCTTGYSADPRTASKEVNNPVANGGRNVKSGDFFDKRTE